MSQTVSKTPPPIAMDEKMKEIMTNYYIEAKTASDSGKRVAWITSGGPVEPLIAMDIIPVYPENHGAMIGASKMGGSLCEQAEAMGYSGDICSYARADIASAVTCGGPIGGLPRPDMLIACNNICGTVIKWYEVLARYYDAPLFIFDTPMCHTDYPEESKRYVQRQVHEYVSFLEQVTGRKLDQDKMEEVGRLSLEAQRLWQAVLDTATARPSPMTAFDGFYHLALIVTLRGTRVAVDYYRDLLAEMEDRVAKGIGAVPNERYRLMWDNLPIWYRLKWLSKKFAAHDAALVADTYNTAWCRSLRYIDENDFLGSMAEGYTRMYLNIGVDQMADTIIEMAEKYSVDGLVMHSNRSCKPYSFGQYDIQRMVRERLDIPCLIIESHMIDERSFSEAQTETRIDAFMELVEEKNQCKER